MWRDSVPVTSFPFEYRDRSVGLIKQTWGDIKDKLGADAVNGALPFCSSHYAPSQMHNLIMSEMNTRHERNIQKLETMKATSAARNRPATAESRRPLTTSAAMAAPIVKLHADKEKRSSMTTKGLAATGTSTGDGESTAFRTAGGTTPGHFSLSRADGGGVTPHEPALSVRPPRPLSALERRILARDGDDNSCGRVEYLRMRRRLPLQHRTSVRRTTSQVYGWEQLDFSERAIGDRAVETSLLTATGQHPAGPPTPEYLPVRVGGPQAAVPPATAHIVPGAAAASTSAARPPSSTACGSPGQYFGKRSFSAQMARRTGVFSRGDFAV
jgi:hypothetical protein